jgi:hypothetical protein
MPPIRRCWVCEDATMECIRSKGIRMGIVEYHYECRRCGQSIDTLNRWGYGVWLTMSLLLVGGTAYAIATHPASGNDNVYIALCVAGLVTAFGVMLRRRWIADRRNPEVAGASLVPPHERGRRDAR